MQSESTAQQAPGQASGQQGWSGGGQQGAFGQTASPGLQNAIADLDRLGTIAEWTKTRASQRGNQRVAQICEDCVDLGELQKRLILRGSPVAHSVAQVFQQSVMDNLQALQQHAHESEVQELIQQAQQVRNSLQQGLTAVPTTSTGQSGASAQSPPTY